MVDRCKEKRKQSDSTSENGAKSRAGKQTAVLEELFLSDKAHLRLNGLTHRLAAA